MPVLLFVTVIASVSLGVLAAYAAVICILHAFGRTVAARTGPPAPGPGPHAEPRQRRLSRRYPHSSGCTGTSRHNLSTYFRTVRMRTR